jgi:CRP-like cAMP-binding protein
MKKNNPHTDCQFCESRLRSIFCNLEKRELEEINSEKKCSVYKKGQLIFRQNSYPHGLYCINSGKVKLYQLAENGKEQIVRLAKAGDILGYRALLSSEEYTSSAETIEETSVCFIPKNTFQKLLRENTLLSMNLMQLLANDLKNAEHKITGLAQRPVKERMAETILYLKEVYGMEKDNATLNVIIRREDMANIAGTATETAIRILAELKNERYIEFIGKKIKIIRMRELIHLANLSD